MIVKAFTAPEPNDPRLHAGWEAEKDLAHFLNRAFEPVPDVLLFHGLRFPIESLPGDAAQIDHLVLYRHGIAIIESKSVSGVLSVDRLGQWTRKWRGRSGRGGEDNIPDPTLQAKRQVDALRRLLDSSLPPLMDKRVGLIPMGFRNFPIEHYVAISTGGRFDGTTRPYEQRVMKADRITNSVNEQIDYHRKNSGWRGWIISKPDEMTIFHLSDTELSRIRDFLLARDTLRSSGNTTSKAQPPSVAALPETVPSKQHAAPSGAAPPASRLSKLDPLVCTKCGEEKAIEVVYRKDYCLLCHACEGYTSLGHACAFCGKHAFIRKDGPSFYRDCAKDAGGCGKQVVFWKSK